MTNFSDEPLRRGARYIFSKFIEPRSAAEDDRRREYILNILLASSILMLAILDSTVLYNSLVMGEAYRGISFFAFSGIVAVFVLLHAISRLGRFTVAAYLFISAYFLSISYAAFTWGVDLPSALMGYALLILISGILLSSRFSFVMTGITAGWIIPLWMLQIRGIVPPKWYWKYENMPIDVWVFSLMLLLTTVISWLANREIERSLIRARRSEAALKEQRDLLETRVEERTSELKRLELERTAELARFAEFGRQATGMVHDLLNPLTAVSLNIEELSRKDREITKETEQYLSRAIDASRRMERSIAAIRQHMSQREAMVSFSLDEEIEQVIRLFEYSARKARVTLTFVSDGQVQVYGDPVKFHQVISGLVSNAIDAYYAPLHEEGRRFEVVIHLTRERDIVRIAVRDWGGGIPQEYMSKIFDPFFTTKDVRRGTGLGLAMAKNLIEQSFGGRILAESVVGEGSTFTVEFAI